MTFSKTFMAETKLLLTRYSFFQTGLNFYLYFTAPLRFLVNFPLMDLEAPAFISSSDPDIESSESAMYVTPITLKYQIPYPKSLII